MRKLFFVYGTLKAGWGNNRRLSTSSLLGAARTVGDYVLVNCGFPYMIPAAEAVTGTHKARPVMGEVWEVTDPSVESSLDALEGVAYGHYKQVEIDVEGYDEKVTTYIPCNGEECLVLDTTTVTEEGYYQWP